MRIPRSRGLKGLRMVVRKRVTPYSLVRPDEESTGRFGEDVDTSSAGPTVNLWCYDPTEINVDTEYGDRLGGDLQGLALPDGDVQVQDRLDHGGETYVVDRIMHIPDNDSPVLKMFSLVKQTNEGR